MRYAPLATASAATGAGSSMRYRQTAWSYGRVSTFSSTPGAMACCPTDVWILNVAVARSNRGSSGTGSHDRAPDPTATKVRAPPGPVASRAPSRANPW